MGSKTLWKNLQSIISPRQVEQSFKANDFAQYLSDVNTQTANNEQSINSVTSTNPTRDNLFCFVHKDARSFRVSDFRPISILPALSNGVVSKCQIYDHLVSHYLATMYVPVWFSSSTQYGNSYAENSR